MKTENISVLRQIYKNLNEEEKVKAVKVQASNLSKAFYAKEKSNKDYVNGGLVSRKGVRGGRATSLLAKNEAKTDTYLDELEQLLFMVKDLYMN